MPLRHQDHSIKVQRGRNVWVTKCALQSASAFFDIKEDIQKEDIIIPQDGFDDENYIVTKVDVNRGTLTGGRLNHKRAHIMPLSDYQEQKKAAEKTAIIQTVYGSIGNMAGQDINQNITVKLYLKSIETLIARDPNIPEDEKKGLLSKIKSLISNSYVANLSSAAIFDMLKNMGG